MLPQRTLEDIEAVNMMRKGQVKRLSGQDSQAQARFVLSLFQIAAWQIVLDKLSCLKVIFAMKP